VFVRDVGEVSDGSDLLTSIAIVNGKPVPMAALSFGA